MIYDIDKLFFIFFNNKKPSLKKQDFVFVGVAGLPSFSR